MEEIYVVMGYNNIEVVIDIYKTKEEAEKAAEYLNNYEEDYNDVYYSVITYELKEKFIPEQED